MKPLLALALAGAFAVRGAALARPDAGDGPRQRKAACARRRPRGRRANPQQERMKECNTKAEGKKGDERKAFMSSCLSGKEAAPRR